MDNITDYASSFIILFLYLVPGSYVEAEADQHISRSVRFVCAVVSDGTTEYTTKF